MIDRLVLVLLLASCAIVAVIIAPKSRELPVPTCRRP